MKSAADLQVADLTVYIGALESQLTNVTKYAESWVRKCDENSTALLELGQSLTWLGQGENHLLGDSLAQVKQYSWKLCLFYYTLRQNLAHSILLYILSLLI